MNCSHQMASQIKEIEQSEHDKSNDGAHYEHGQNPPRNHSLPRLRSGLNDWRSLVRHADLPGLGHFAILMQGNKVSTMEHCSNATCLTAGLGSMTRSGIPLKPAIAPDVFSSASKSFAG
jgi:hypothetical protein